MTYESKDPALSPGNHHVLGRLAKYMHENEFRRIDPLTAAAALNESIVYLDALCDPTEELGYGVRAEFDQRRRHKMKRDIVYLSGTRSVTRWSVTTQLYDSTGHPAPKIDGPDDVASGEYLQGVTSFDDDEDPEDYSYTYLVTPHTVYHLVSRWDTGNHATYEFQELLRAEIPEDLWNRVIVAKRQLARQ
ncbi:MAG: hypothetical protein JRJ69_10335 [Deltaproteobacteria bacterium]|nr:hypothetical protein [Deltaproteobacteria bacterium]